MITLINVSQHINGINDQLCRYMSDKLDSSGLEYRYIQTRDLNIAFCNNCRLCMKPAGNDLGICHINDDMRSLIDSMLSSDVLILSAPVNCYDLPSIIRILLERMSVFCHWSDEMRAPKVRDTGRDIKGVLITTSALPGIMVPLLTQVKKTYTLFAKPLRIKKTDYYHIGFKGRKQDSSFTDNDRKVVQSIISTIIKTKRGAA